MSACTVPRITRNVCLFNSWHSSTVGSRPSTSLNAFICWSIAVLKNIAKIIGAGPLIVIETDVDGEIRSNPSYNLFISSNVQTLTQLSPTFQYTSDSYVGTSPYNVTDTNTVSTRCTYS